MAVTLAESHVGLAGSEEERYLQENESEEGGEGEAESGEAWRGVQTRFIFSSGLLSARAAVKGPGLQFAAAGGAIIQIIATPNAARCTRQERCEDGEQSFSEPSSSPIRCHVQQLSCYDIGPKRHDGRFSRSRQSRVKAEAEEGRIWDCPKSLQRALFSNHAERRSIEILNRNFCS